MSTSKYARRRVSWAWLLACGALAAAGAAAPARAEDAPPPAPSVAPVPDLSAIGLAPVPPPVVDGQVTPAGCATCGGGLPPGGCASGSCGAGGQCKPGVNSCFCSGWEAETAFGRLLNGVYQCVCCPDPCYEPHWTPVADSAFFVDAARPVNQTRLRYDHDWQIHTPDRGEYFWAAPNFGGRTLIGPGPKPCARTGFGKGMSCVPDTVDADELFLYTEAGTGRFSAFVEMAYESLDPHTAPAFAAAGFDPCCHESGFGDMNVGTKAMLLDCQLLQLTFQFKTFIPTGAFTKGLGTGHVSLEPSLLMGLCLTPDCYLQGQTSYWIPIGGDNIYQANIFHTHWSLNHVLCRPCPGLQLVGTLEFNDWWVLGGAYTETGFLYNGTMPVAGTGGGSNIFSFGPGLRLFVCDKIDIGVGSAFAVGGDRWADEVLRTEFRWRF